MKENIKSQIAVLFIKIIMLMFALSILFVLIFKLDSAIGFPKETTELKSDYPISESVPFSWEYPSFLRNKKKKSVLKFIYRNKEPNQVRNTNYDPYLYMHKSNVCNGNSLKKLFYLHRTILIETNDSYHSLRCYFLQLPLNRKINNF